MRQTFTQLQTTCKDYISQASGSVASSTIANFIKEHINKKYHFIQSKLKGYIVTDLPQTTTTVTDQQRYHYPHNIYPPITSATLELNDVDYPLTVVNSQKQWDQLNQISYAGITIPQFIFPMRDHFELWPIPSTTGDTITLIASMLDKDMTAEDYTSGSVDVTQNSATVVGTATTFTAAMVGRWFSTINDGFWYRISGFTDTTHITLESVFESSTDTTASYIIGEVPEIPPETHELIPHGVAAEFFAGPSKDFGAAQAHNNYFYTGDYSNGNRSSRYVSGGLIDAIKTYSKKNTSSIIYKRASPQLYDERWSSVLSSDI